MSSTSRRRAIAVAALLAVAPALAACGAGFDANVNVPYAPTEAGVHISGTGVDSEYGHNGVKISQAFILGPEAGAQIAAGGSAPLYLTMVNTNPAADALTAIVPDDGQATSVRIPNAFQLSPDTLAKSSNTTVEGLKQKLLGGETVKLTLKFKNAGDVTMNVPVIPRSREFATLPPASDNSQPPATDTTAGGTTDTTTGADTGTTGTDTGATDTDTTTTG
ncbi:copper chaperone PCu(A)C [Microtetraspora malaysiensis]|uniref:copper chaperone PCu(A)C n=1 Tax=Microtetraspora malaysiensis TaxID=161358 RepID=UPI003D92727A